MSSTDMPPPPVPNKKKQQGRTQRDSPAVAVKTEVKTDVPQSQKKKKKTASSATSLGLTPCPKSVARPVRQAPPAPSGVPPPPDDYDDEDVASIAKAGRRQSTRWKEVGHEKIEVTHKVTRAAVAEAKALCENRDKSENCKRTTHSTVVLKV